MVYIVNNFSTAFQFILMGFFSLKEGWYNKQKQDCGPNTVYIYSEPVGWNQNKT